MKLLSHTTSYHIISYHIIKALYLTFSLFKPTFIFLNNCILFKLNFPSKLQILASLLKIVSPIVSIAISAYFDLVLSAQLEILNSKKTF